VIVVDNRRFVKDCGCIAKQETAAREGALYRKECNCPTVIAE
jgi:hypothetical protein